MDYQGSHDEWIRRNTEQNVTRAFNTDENAEYPPIYPRRRRPQPNILWISVVFVVVIVVIGSGLVAIKSFLPTPVPPCSTHSSNPVSLSMYYDTEIQDWIKDVVNDFNKRKMVACDGPITVNATGLNPGETIQNILNSQIKPDIWSPGGSAWLELLNQQWQQKHGNNIITTDMASLGFLNQQREQKYGNDIVSTEASDTPSLVKSPVVIAMWKPMAEALGWPDKPIGWADIAALSTNPQGWGADAYGHHPEWGTFKFGHTYPDNSNSGLDAVIAENYAAVQKTSGLTIDDVNKAKTQDFVAKVESSIIHYGDNTDIFADEMFNKGPSYLSAAVMNESAVVEANTGEKYSHLAYPVVAIYPKEGTFVSDYPFAVPQASWLTPAKKNAALLFRDFLLAPAQQEKALQDGLRPGTSAALDAPINNVHGVNPNQPIEEFQSPLHNIPSNIMDQELRKVDVMLILDHSGSMKGTKLDDAKAGMEKFVNLLHDGDQLGLTVFSDQANVVASMGPLKSRRQQVLASIDSVVADGNTLLFDTIAAQQEVLQNMPSKDIKALVVLSDGRDTVSQMTLAQLVQQVSPTGENAGSGVKIYTIAYGSDADANALTTIADKTGGQEYPGTPESISKVYYNINQALP